jgi:uridine kinase
MKIIAFAGRAGVGKTTIVRELMRLLYEAEYFPIYIPFAKELKEEAKELGFDKETNPQEYRKHCQELGAMKRKQNPDYWIERWEEHVEKAVSEENSSASSHKRVILVDDCRYLNETERIKNRGGKVIFVSGGNRTLADDTAAWRTHESEALANLTDRTLQHKHDMISPFCEYYWNTESLEELEEDISLIFEEWLEEFPCTCELCVARRQNRKVDADKVMCEIKEILLSEDIDTDEIYKDDSTTESGSN